MKADTFGLIQIVLQTIGLDQALREERWDAALHQILELCSSLSCHNNEEYICDSLKEEKKSQDPESVNDDIPVDGELQRLNPTHTKKTGKIAIDPFLAKQGQICIYK